MHFESKNVDEILIFQKLSQATLALEQEKAHAEKIHISEVKKIKMHSQTDTDLVKYKSRVENYLRFDFFETS